MMLRLLSLWMLLLGATPAWADDIQKVHPGYYIGPNGPFLQHFTMPSNVPSWLAMVGALLIVGFMICLILYGAMGGPRPHGHSS